ncbi:MAG: SurA N-terminal domain-containing protein [Clostridium sp.]|nr:SurA N-terminal domain-containing protein [Clostridium sp.]
MATLLKIRSRSKLLATIIGLALLAFIAEGLFSSIQSSRNEQRMNIARINGEKITAQEFQDMVEEFSNVLKATSGQTNFDDVQMTQLRDQVWNTFVNFKLIESEAEKLGLTVTDTEIQNIINEGNSPLLNSSPFRNPQTGRFDAAELKNFLTTYEDMKNSADMTAEVKEYYTNIYNLWMFIEKSLRQEALQNKYTALLQNSFISNPISAKDNYEGRINESDILLAAVPYTSLPDSTVQVSDADINAKYKEYKEAFIQNTESRDIKYITIQVTASQADRAELDKEMAEYNQMLAEGQDPAKVVRESGSSVAYYSLPVKKEVYPRDIAAQLDSMQVGAQNGPVYNISDNTLNIVRLTAKVNMPDSIEYRQIQVAAQDEATVKKTSDSIMTALNSGADFEEIAKKYGQTGAKSWLTSAQYDGAQLDANNLKYIKALTETPTNQIVNLPIGGVNIILQITDRRAMVDKYTAAVIKRVVDFSKDTYTKAYNDFSHFLASNTTLDDIEANAQKNGYRVMDYKGLQSTEHYVANQRNTTEALRWIFNEDTKKGDISGLYECGNNDCMLVVVLTDIHEKGYLKAEDVKEFLTSEVIKDKKATLLKDQLAKTKSVAEAGNINGAKVDTIKHITFNSPAFIRAIGASEPILSGAVSASAKGAYKAGVKGNSGVYAFQVLSQNKSNEQFDSKKEEEQLAGQQLNAARNFIMELRQKADIEDNRYLFF